jgi:hypothetical protein
MAAIIGIALWAELPRVAIQSQRAKEQMLIERGEQFKRAIQLYLRANKGTRFPADMDDLDRGYNNLRFLRHRYKDPMTGKDEWRIIHMQGGVLTDSLLTKPKGSDKPEDSTLGQNISAHQGLGELANAGQPAPNAINRRRPSEGGSGGGVGPDGQPIQPGDQSSGTQPGAGPTPAGFQPGGVPGAAQQQGVPGAPGGPQMPFGPAPGSAGIPGMPGAPGQFPGQFPGQPPGVPGQFGLPGANTGANSGGFNSSSSGDSGSSVGNYGSSVGGSTVTAAVPSAQPNAPGLAGMNPGLAGANPGLGGANPANPGSGPVPGAGLGPNSPANLMLQQMLTTPRPQGFPGNATNQGTVVGGGMAGVASKMDADGLMVYNDRTNYKEWEFVYDPTKDRPRMDPRSMLVGNQMGSQSGNTASPTSTMQQGNFSTQLGPGGPGAPGPGGMGPSGQPGSTGQPGSGGQSGMPASPGGYNQGGNLDIRPGKK